MDSIKYTAVLTEIEAANLPNLDTEECQPIAPLSRPPEIALQPLPPYYDDLHNDTSKFTHITGYLK